MKCVPRGGESSSLGGLEEINLSLLPYPPAMVHPLGRGTQRTTPYRELPSGDV